VGNKVHGHEGENGRKGEGENKDKRQKSSNNVMKFHKAGKKDKSDLKVLPR
jgi:hypothetical protein